MLGDPPPSWRVDHGDSDVLQIALFVRDDGADLHAAGRQWPSWWQQGLELQFANRSTPTPG